MTHFTSISVYTPLSLKIYDFYVLRFSCRFAWVCPNREILKLYEQFASNKHLATGVGSGYFLNKFHWNHLTPDLTIFDLNQDCLDFCAARIKRLQPKVVQGDLSHTIALANDSYQSICLNFVLHCIKGDLRQKAVVFDNLKALLAPGGVIFGATILNHGVKQNFLSRKLIKIYNKQGIFGNENDSLDDLIFILEQRFKEVEITVIGSVALFSARKN